MCRVIHAVELHKHQLRDVALLEIIQDRVNNERIGAAVDLFDVQIVFDDAVVNGAPVVEGHQLRVGESPAGIIENRVII